MLASRVWLCISVIPVLGRPRKENSKFQASLSYHGGILSQEIKTEKKIF
jgi:hypothetical protein